jgi:geranylgeranylglycerol-phosphate geranylgeranyltransferase
MWLVTSIAAIFLNLLLPLAALLIVMGSVVVLFVYSAVLKRTMLAGNAVVAGMTGLAFLYAAIIAEEPVQGLMPAGFAFLANFSREIVKDVEDLEGDLRQGASTFPIVHGIRPALITASLVIWVLIALTVVAHISGIYSRAFLGVVSVVDIVLAYTALALLKEMSPSAMHPHSLRLKLCMAGGLVAIIVGSL